MSEPQPRPRHTSFAVGIVMVGSALLIVGVAETLLGIRSLDTRQAVARAIRDLGLGWSVDSGLAAYRAWLMLLAGCAAAAAVLAWQVARRSRGARVGLSVLAVPLFFGGAAAGGFLASMVAAAIAILWVGPSRAWLAREPVATSGAATQAGPTQPAPPRASPWPAGPVVTPAGRAPQPARRHRPDAVVWACVLTWSFCALTAVVLAASVALMAMSPSLVFDQVDRTDPGLVGTDISRSELIHATYLTGGLGIAWAVAAAVIAVFVWRGARWARTVLMASAAATAVLGLLGAVTSLLLVVPGLVGVATISMLNTAEARAWYQWPHE